MKKIVGIILMCITVLVLSGCNKENKEAKEETKETSSSDVLKDLTAEEAWNKVAEVMTSDVTYYKLEGIYKENDTEYNYLAEWSKDNYYVKINNQDGEIFSMIIVNDLHSATYSNSTYVEQDLSTNIKAFFDLDTTKLSDYAITTEDDYYILSFTRVSNTAETKNTYYINKKGMVERYTVTYAQDQNKEVTVELKDINELETVDLSTVESDMQQFRK